MNAGAIDAVVAGWTGIPVTRLTEDRRKHPSAATWRTTLHRAGQWARRRR
ncbi:MAG: hypothetical protein ACLT9P_07015 [Evtepia gabavorous]